ncbi:MAG TPA: hypothetical protein VIL70_05765 [Chthoniobacterales bacterium]|jgi:hypothetical protein
MTSHDFWLVVEAASTFVLAVAAVIALSQLFWAKQSLEIAKKDILVRSDREAKALAAQLCEKYGSETMLYVAQQFEELKKKGPYKPFETREVKVAWTSFADQAAAEAAGKAMCDNRIQLVHTFNILNLHESSRIVLL